MGNEGLFTVGGPAAGLPCRPSVAAPGVGMSLYLSDGVVQECGPSRDGELGPEWKASSRSHCSPSTDPRMLERILFVQLMALIFTFELPRPSTPSRLAA
jgi:hypothetical protein